MNANLPAINSDAAPILLVENDPMDLDLMLCALEEAGFSGRVSVARFNRGTAGGPWDSGRTASAIRHVYGHPRAWCERSRYPRRLRVIQQTWRLPVVMLTGASDAGAIAACYSLGANACLVKPNEYRGLVRMMQTSAQFRTGCNRSPFP